MDVICPFCEAYHWHDEMVASSPNQRPEFGMCCQRGHVLLPQQSVLPPIMYRLFDSNDNDAKEFRSHICQYNMALAFTSLGVTEDRNVNRRAGWVFRIEGELCHLIGSLRPQQDRLPSYAQLYIYDAGLALEQRMYRNDERSSSTMHSLQSMLLEYHPFTDVFKHAFKILDHYPRNSDAHIRLRVMPGQDRRRYNLPSTDEIAIILPGDGTASQRRDIVLRARTDDNSLARINNGHPTYCPLHYVLLFPNGNLQWHCDLFHRPVPGTTPSQGWNPP